MNDREDIIDNTNINDDKEHHGEEEQENTSYHSDAGSDITDSDFEGHDGYKRGGYHPVHVGEIYNNRYIVLRKLGWGHFSTVWLCDDTHTKAKVALKVQKSAEHYTEAAYDEIDILNTVSQETLAFQQEQEIQIRRDYALALRRLDRKIARQKQKRVLLDPDVGNDNTNQPTNNTMNNINNDNEDNDNNNDDDESIDDEEDAVDYAAIQALEENQLPELPEEMELTPFNPHVVHLVDSFLHQGPNGSHMCMVFQTLGDNVLSLIKAYRYHGIPIDIVRRFTRHILIGLSFLHSRCGVIHTDLKPENVLLSEKLPPVPKLVEELEGCDEVIVECTPEEAKAEEEREILQARKLGLTIETVRNKRQNNNRKNENTLMNNTEESGNTTNNNNGSSTIDNIDEHPSLIGLTGKARKNARKKLRKLKEIEAGTVTPAETIEMNNTATTAEPTPTISTVTDEPLPQDIQHANKIVDEQLLLTSNFISYEDKVSNINSSSLNEDTLRIMNARGQRLCGTESVSSGTIDKGYTVKITSIPSSTDSIALVTAVDEIPSDYSTIPLFVPKAYLLNHFAPYITKPIVNASSATLSSSSVSTNVVVPPTVPGTSLSSTVTSSSSPSSDSETNGWEIKLSVIVPDIKKIKAQSSNANQHKNNKKGKQKGKQRSKKQEDKSSKPNLGESDNEEDEDTTSSTDNSIKIFIRPRTKSATDSAVSVPHTIFRETENAYRSGVIGSSSSSSSNASTTNATYSTDDAVSGWTLSLSNKEIRSSLQTLETLLPHVSFMVVPQATLSSLLPVDLPSFDTAAVTKPVSELPPSVPSSTTESSSSTSSSSTSSVTTTMSSLNAFTPFRLIGTYLDAQIIALLRSTVSSALHIANRGTSTSTHESEALIVCPLYTDWLDIDEHHIPAFIPESNKEPLPKKSTKGLPYILQIRPLWDRLLPWISYLPVKANTNGTETDQVATVQALSLYHSKIEMVAKRIASARKGSSIKRTSSTVTKVSSYDSDDHTESLPTVRTKIIRITRTLNDEEKAIAQARYAREWEEWETKVRSMDAYVVDLGNACWIHKHFSEDIQTRQYRSPEVIIGNGYDTSADMWSLGCMVFEMLTGELLFDPQAGDNYSRDEDHLAQMQELLGVIPRRLALRGKHSKEYFNGNGELLHIKQLRFWGPASVLVEKYGFDRIDAAMIESFLLPTLTFDPTHRGTADDALDHPWLKIHPETGELVDWSSRPDLVPVVLNAVSQGNPLVFAAGNFLNTDNNGKQYIDSTGTEEEETEDYGDGNEYYEENGEEESYTVGSRHAHAQGEEDLDFDELDDDEQHPHEDDNTNRKHFAYTDEDIENMSTLTPEQMRILQLVQQQSKDSHNNLYHPSSSKAHTRSTLTNADDYVHDGDNEEEIDGDDLDDDEDDNDSGGGLLSSLGINLLKQSPLEILRSLHNYVSSATTSHQPTTESDQDDDDEQDYTGGHDEDENDEEQRNEGNQSYHNLPENETLSLIMNSLLRQQPTNNVIQQQQGEVETTGTTRTTEDNTTEKMEQTE